MPGLFGGSKTTKQKTETESVPVYPAEAGPLLAREYEMIANLLLPQEIAGINEYAQRARALPGTGAPRVSAAANQLRAAAPQAYGAFGPSETALADMILGLEAGAPAVLGGLTPSLLPAQYASLFAPQTQTRTTSQARGPSADPFSTLLGLGQVASLFVR